MKTIALIATVTLIASQVVGDGTLYREEVPVRSHRRDKPRVENPADYDVYVGPEVPANAPLVAASLLRGAPRVKKYVPKPFVPRERKQVKKLQASGPVLYPAPRSGYAEPRYGSIDIHQDLSKIPGYPGKDYPVYSEVPETGFTCDRVPYRPGLYADPEAQCQVYHICENDNRHGYASASFLCTNGTLFNQYELTCDWWYNVDCAQSAAQYDVNLDPYKNPYLPTPEEEAGRQYGPQYV